MKPTLRFLLSVILLFSVMPGLARGSGESVQLGMEATSTSGKLFRDFAKPVAAKLHIEVQVPPGTQSVTPMINSNVTFPADMGFYPDSTKTPVCPPSKVGPTAGLPTGIASVVRACPRSVIGTGSARIHLARSATLPTLDDPKLVIFNAGRTSEGRPRITIYGYSKNANAGVYMSGFLAENGELDIGVGLLPFDSSIAEFTLGIPGDPIEVEGGEPSVIKGLDPGYLRAKCSSDSWDATGEFAFATRNESTGQLTSTPFRVSSNTSSLDCDGYKGRVKWGAVRLKGPKTFVPGRSRVLRLVVSNSGTATARRVGVRVRGAGRGKSTVGKIAPRSSKVVPVKATFGGSPESQVIAVRVAASGLERTTRIRLSPKD